MLGLSGMLLCGCASWPFEGNAQVTPAGTAPQLAQADAQDGATADSDGYGYPDYSNIEPAAGPAPARAARQRAAAPTAGVATAYPALVDPVMAQRTAALQNEVAKLEDRLQRVEKAALRLDRRMQLVERNELSKMNTAANDDDSAPRAADAGDNNGSDAFNNDSGAPTTIKVSGPRAGYGDGFQPVSTPITSALQAAPRGETVSARAPQSTAQVASNQLPSLADPVTTSSRVPDGDDKLAIWTVHYNNDKVWPERDQLPSSRDVVSLLREGGKATLFARGAQPNSREFRERVKALSRYLAKVSSLDSVPIAALSAPHLDGDTIEVFAQP
jgi:hypothetical protein